MFTVDLIVTVIKAVGKPERFHPLTQIVPSLRQYFRYLHNFADINLQVYSETLRSCDWQNVLRNETLRDVDEESCVALSRAAAGFSNCKLISNF